MATKLIMRSSADEFVEFIKNADEVAVWNALGDAMSAIARIKMSKPNRKRIIEILKAGEDAYAERFGTSWVPF